MPNEKTTIEEVYAFPEDYNGQKLEFNGVLLEGDLSRSDDYPYFVLDVQGKSGRSTETSLSQWNEGIAFVVSHEIARGLIKQLETYSTYKANIKCQIKAIEENEDDDPDEHYKIWIAEVIDIEIIGDVDDFQEEDINDGDNPDIDNDLEGEKNSDSSREILSISISGDIDRVNTSQSESNIMINIDNSIEIKIALNVSGQVAISKSGK